MPAIKGREDVRSFLQRSFSVIETKVLRGAARAAATVVADEAKVRSISDLVSASVKVGVKRVGDRHVARVYLKGKGAFIAPWLEYGTSPHFISVDDSQRNGMSVGRINRLGKESSLVIGGNFVGKTVLHPGARPHPFLRPALDAKRHEAVKEAQAYIDRKVSRRGVIADDDQ